MDQKQKSPFGLVGYVIIGLVLLSVFRGGFFGGNTNQNTNRNTGRSTQTTTSTPTSGKDTLYVLAGSELKDLEPYLQDIAKATDVNLALTYTGTLDGVEELTQGNPRNFDAAWFSHGKYLSLVGGTLVAAEEKIMLSPVVLGVKKNLAQRWGWTAREVTWQDIADKANSGELKFAMTNPASSNSGFTALMGVVAAFANTSDAPTTEDIAIAEPRLKEFFAGQALTSGSSGWLAESYVREQDRLDGIINYESVLLELNESKQLTEPLHLLYPKEGIITADYPLSLLNNEKRAAFERVIAYLTSQKFQQTLTRQTNRRPVNPNVQKGKQFPDQLLIELPFPGNRDVIDGILYAYLDDARVPAHAVFVLDTSGSMDGERITQLKQAMNNLTGLDTSLTGKFARFSNREILTIIPFDDNVGTPQTFTIADASPNGADMVRIREYVDRLRAGGGTAIYSALDDAYEYLERTAANDEAAGIRRYYSIVLMSDGKSNEGMRFRRFVDRYDSGEYGQIKVFPVLFGNADSEEMAVLAARTGGRVFDGRSGSLGAVFKQIRGYQ